jgi:3-oxoacyl-[acyl-carrier protein] reductase
MEMKEAVVLVTGAGRGIGRAIALAFAEAGVKTVLINDIPAQEAVAKETVSAIKDLGVNAKLILWDVSDYGATQNAAKEIESLFGGVDVLINNAGITRDQLFIRMDESSWDKVMNVNAKSVFNCCKAFLPGMLKNRWGKIVSISSVVALIGNAGQTNYAASKAAVIGFSKSLAKEYANKGIRVNVVTPGFIDTEMTKQIPEKAREQLLAVVRNGRPGTPADVARVVLKLALSDDNGKVVPVEEGWIDEAN